ncbi:MAG: hypothetical protein WC785_05530 [Tatlockia sp.]|jgi:hypothetical protein
MKKKPASLKRKKNKPVLIEENGKKRKEDRELDNRLKDTFPASDSTAEY